MEGTRIDPRAVVHPEARIGKGAFIGPFCVVGPNVEIGDHCHLASHVVVEGRTVMVTDNLVSPMASLGGPPQDLKYRGEDTGLTI